MGKKNAQPHKNAELSAQDSAYFSKTPKLTPRQTRLVHALIALSPGEWMAREEVDRIAGASNGPQVVAEVRQMFGRDSIDMRRVAATDRDGRPCNPGRYRLTDAGRSRITAIIGCGCHG